MIHNELKKNELVVLHATLILRQRTGLSCSIHGQNAKMAGISPGTIYLYFENKQDMLDKLYLYIKSDMCRVAFEKHRAQGDEFKAIWYCIAKYKITHSQEAMFMAICDILPIITDACKQKGIEMLMPLIDLCKRGQQAGIIRRVPHEMIYAYSINPLSLLIFDKDHKRIKLSKQDIDKAFEMTYKAISSPNRIAYQLNF